MGQGGEVVGKPSNPEYQTVYKIHRGGDEERNEGRKTVVNLSSGLAYLRKKKSKEEGKERRKRGHKNVPKRRKTSDDVQQRRLEKGGGLR